MKHNFSALLLFFLICFSGIAQDILWEKSYGGVHADYLFDAQPTADFGFILAGSSVSDKSGNKQEKNLGNLDYWIWKMDQNGALDWQKSLGGNGVDLLKKVLVTRDGGYLLAGTSTSGKNGTKFHESYGYEDFWIIKLNADGSEQWQKTFGGIGNDILQTAIETSEGGFVLAGSSTSPKSALKKNESFGNKDYWIIQIDSQGTVEWENSFGGQYIDQVEAIAPAPEQGYYVLGYSNSDEGESKKTQALGEGDYWLLRLDKDGNSLWQKSYGGKDDDHPVAMIALKDGGILIGGNSATSNSTIKQSKNKKGTDYWLLKLEDSGTIIWDKTYDIGLYDILSSLSENKDGSLLLAGYARSENIGLKKTDSKGVNDYVAIKLDEKGEEKWRQEVGSNGDDILSKLIKTRDGGYVLAGTTNGLVSGSKNSIQGRHDFWVVKLGDEENREDTEGIPMVEAFPNPTSGYTNIVITEAFEKGDAYLYDVQGRLLQQYKLKNRTLPINFSSLPVGIYVVYVETNTGSDSVKIIKKD